MQGQGLRVPAEMQQCLGLWIWVAGFRWVFRFTTYGFGLSG